MEFYPTIKNNEILPFAIPWTNLVHSVLSEISQTETNTIRYHLYVESKKKGMNINKQKQTHGCIE